MHPDNLPLARTRARVPRPHSGSPHIRPYPVKNTPPPFQPCPRLPIPGGYQPDPSPIQPQKKMIKNDTQYPAFILLQTTPPAAASIMQPSHLPDHRPIVPLSSPIIPRSS